jgi:hypothetical protein
MNSIRSCVAALPIRSLAVTTPLQEQLGGGGESFLPNPQKPRRGGGQKMLNCTNRFGCQFP